MPDFDAYLKAFSAVANIAFAIVIFAGGRQRGGPLFLATFLLLIAGNQAAETLRALVAAETAAWYFWWRVAAFFAALDPLALFLFGRAMQPEPHRGWSLYAVGGTSAILAVFAPLQGSSVGLTHELVLLTFTAIVYAAVFARFLRGVSIDPSSARTRIFVHAAAVAAVWPALKIPYAVAVWLQIDILGVGPGHPLELMHGWAGTASWFLLLAAASLAIWLGSRLPNGRVVARVAATALGLGYAMAAVLNSAGLTIAPTLGVVPDPGPPWLPGLAILGRAAVAVRWLIFGALMSTAILREDMLGMSLAARRSAARGLVALAIIGSLGLFYAGLTILFGVESLTLRPFDWFMLAFVLLVAAQGFRPLIDGVAARLYAVPVPADRAAAHATYRRAVQQAMAEGRDARNDPELGRLRRELDMDEAEAATVERVADEGLASPIVTGQRIGARYLIKRLVGRGGAGRVFLAHDETLHRDVVLKEVLHDDPGDEAALREARMAGGLNHPNVVVVHDVLRRPGVSLLVVEYVPGGSLDEHVASHGLLSPAEGVRILEGILAGLEAVHARGLVHRDLKPHNILMAAGGVPKISDFGIARARRGVTARFDEPDAFVGTPGFMAPEQRAGARATASSDIYGVGRLARACIRQPLPPALEQVIGRALAEDPAQRYQTPGEMREALRRASAAVLS